MVTHLVLHVAIPPSERFCLSDTSFAVFSTDFAFCGADRDFHV